MLYRYTRCLHLLTFARRAASQGLSARARRLKPEIQQVFIGPLDENPIVGRSLTSVQCEFSGNLPPQS